MGSGGLALGRRLKVKPSEAKSPVLLTQLTTSGVISFRLPGCPIDQMLSGMQRALCPFHVWAELSKMPAFLRWRQGPHSSPDAWPRLLWPTLVLRARARGSHFGNRDAHTGALTNARNQSFPLGRVESCLASRSKGTQGDCDCGLWVLHLRTAFILSSPHM